MEMVNRIVTGSSWRPAIPLEDLVEVETTRREIAAGTKVMMSSICRGGRG
jgi:hypothetical protein